MAQANGNRFRSAGGPCTTPLGTFWEAQVKYGPSYRGSTSETTKASLNSSGFQRGQQLHHLAALHLITDGQLQPPA